MNQPQNNESHREERSRCYIRVSETQRQAFLRLINNSGRMLIKDAAKIVGIKYSRATYIYRQYRASLVEG